MAPPEPPAPSGFARNVRRTFAGIAFALVLVAVAFVTQSIVQRTSLPTTIAGDFIPSPQSLFHKDRIAILLLGIDYDYDKNDQEYSTNARTDTIKAVALNAPTAANPNGSISILSIPRDTDVVLPSGREDKINAAYSGHDGNTAAASHATQKVVANFLGVPGFDRYLTLRINATKELVDAIGGIDVIPDETMNYDDSWGHLHIHFVGGKKYHMNGEQAVSYARFRHDACSDPCRIKRQDQVIKLAIAKLKNDKFNDLTHIDKLIDVVRHNVYTDLSQQEMFSLAWAFQHVDPARLETKQVPFVADKDLACCGNVLIADDAAKSALVKRMFLTAPAATAVDPAVAAISPATIHVQVQNGSGIRGIGAKLATALGKAGFVVDGVANAPSFTYDATEVHVGSAAAPNAGQRVLMALALPTATLAPQPEASPTAPAGDVTVIVGRDYAATGQEASAVK